MLNSSNSLFRRWGEAVVTYGIDAIRAKVLFFWSFSLVHQAGKGDSLLLVLGCGMGRGLQVVGN